MPVDRCELEQEWNFDPEQSLPIDAPQPWYVAGYSFKSVDNVMRVDYLAVRVKHPRTIYEVPGGRVTYIGHAEELRGLPHGVGTLFVLWPIGIEAAGNLARIIDEARSRVGETRSLRYGPRANNR